ncbi:MAG TPA: hypothetical protein DHS36_01185 [Candidatus Veblenbacteria bacterium]|uniref:Histidine triad (HIT) protein n=1 Tax=Candidatus Giovannonibacteria bacterium GW2011_GWF2_42_19 TaxID=1618659 RepID=A0A0G1BLT8_9BACT|nr:MAG: Histidine triad (HIT) protein [Candidatus Giovannonibacteria bacterium GW2011_GWF2_42_19]HCX38862.1 hypothetical protein [Candidatus Veblenbacteria bacterium]
MIKDNTMCSFCDKASFAHQITFENKHFFVLVARSYLTPGHVMIVPKKHRTDLSAITKDNEKLFFKTLNNTISKLRTAFGADGFNILSNIGRPAGQTVPHFHIHVIPRSTKEKYNPLKLIFDHNLRHSAKPSRSDVIRIVKKIKRVKA